MALRNQPYFPLYVQDYLTDEKLNLCSWQTQGIYIKILCILHKQKDYGKLLLKQIPKQDENICLLFAEILVRLLPCQLNEMERAVSELIDNDVLQIDYLTLYQKRMVKDNQISETRAKVGSIGGKKTQFAKAKDKAKCEANSEYENENVIEVKNRISIICNGNSEKVFEAFEKWKDYLAKQHDVILKENEYTYQILESKIGEIGASNIINAIDHSIKSNYKKIFPKKQTESKIQPPAR